MCFLLFPHQLVNTYIYLELNPIKSVELNMTLYSTFKNIRLKISNYSLASTSSVAWQKISY